MTMTQSTQNNEHIVIEGEKGECPCMAHNKHALFFQGWFAGRNLAVSQVTTKYFLWVDDDFVFTEETKIEKLVDVLDGTDLDVVGGNVAGNHFSITLLLEEGGDEGDCLHWEKGAYHQIEGFPNCVLCSGVVNFFLAHTERVLGVGFDPKLNRIAHTEFFIDGLGRLRVGSCDHVIIGHQKKKKPAEEKLLKLFRKYTTFRKKNSEEQRAKYELLHFKNRLSCFIKKYDFLSLMDLQTAGKKINFTNSYRSNSGNSKMMTEAYRHSCTRCATCKSASRNTKKRKEFVSNVMHKCYQIESLITCSSVGVVYMLECDCGLQYVGHTSRALQH
ncbi:beta-1,4 N-acetylgalactosaminyltransferase 2-like [Aquarana catesbeiana]|uniref:beta-1,4 N-acetylgalactosaminyltransferase 2-like n=1 Tax=Aquarana catesbeiana TaxID=8400 RepID=UPI003CC9D26A